MARQMLSSHRRSKQARYLMIIDGAPRLGAGVGRGGWAGEREENTCTLMNDANVQKQKDDDGG